MVVKLENKKKYEVLNMQESKKVIRKILEVGYVKGEKYGYSQKLPVTIDIELSSKMGRRRDISLNPVDEQVRLSICGEIWRLRRTDCIACGQINDTLMEHYRNGELKLTIPEKLFLKIMEIWEKWHLNDLRAGCKHQEELKKRMIENGQVEPKFFYASNYNEIIKLPEFAKCPYCGYKYGSSWLYEPLPHDVMEFITELIGVEKNDGGRKSC